MSSVFKRFLGFFIENHQMPLFGHLVKTDDAGQDVMPCESA
jgi:hypothetical protein